MSNIDSINARMRGASVAPCTQSEVPQLLRSSGVRERRVAPWEPARRVMTDFRYERVLSITADRPIDEGLAVMKTLGVRSLVVIQGDRVLGLVTSYDIQGERPLQFLRWSNRSRHDEIEIGDVMTPWRELVTLDWRIVCRAVVSDVVFCFQRSQPSHVLVVESSDDCGSRLRGIISNRRLERQLETGQGCGPVRDEDRVQHN